jgi:hypothetical protein
VHVVQILHSVQQRAEARSSFDSESRIALKLTEDQRSQRIIISSISNRKEKLLPYVVEGVGTRQSSPMKQGLVDHRTDIRRIQVG